MKIKKRWIVFGLIFSYIAGKLLIEKFDNRPVKFEQHKTRQSVESYLNIHYPVGSDGSKLISELINSGAECSSIGKEHKHFVSSKRYASVKEECKEITTCQYMTGFISIRPLKDYEVTVYINNTNGIVRYYATVFNLPN